MKVLVSPITDELEQDLARCRGLAQLLDAQFELLGFRFGMDAIIGLVPGIGDLASAGAGLYLLHVARKHRLGRWVISRMAANLAADFLLGACPVVGDIADAMFKANLKNLKILEAAAARRREASGTEQ